MRLGDLKEWLLANGFCIAPNNFREPYNDCGWYAYRRSALPARECETNDGKPAQILVYPYLSQMSPNGSVKVALCGEAGGVWWELRAYSLAFADLPAKLPAIETGLVAAWNALLPEEVRT